MMQMMNVVNQLTTHGKVVTNQNIVEKVLRIIPPKFDMVVTTVEESKNLAQFFIEELIGSLLNHESRIGKHGESLKKFIVTRFN